MSTIHINPANKGKFTETKRRTGKSTEELTHSKNPLTRKRAIFAQNARKWHHDQGGSLDEYMEGARMDQGGELIDGYSSLLFLGGLTGATAITGGADVAGQLSGVINPNTKGGGAASGAMKGASMGSALGPYGMAAGALIGGTAGFIGSQNKQNREDFYNSINDIKNRNATLGIKAHGGKIILPVGVNSNMWSEYADGGMLTEFNNGGLHETNPYQGIPQGVAPDGNVNKVEEGETKWKDYIFSNRLVLDKDTVEKHNLPTRLIGKSFADASKIMSKIHKERPNDPISKNTAEDHMKRLMYANDSVREADSSMMAMGGNLYAWGDKINVSDRFSLGQNKLSNTTNDPLNILNKVGDVSSLSTKQKNSKIVDFLKDKKNLRYAPIAFDALAATGLFGKTPTPETYSPTLIQNQGLLSPELMDEMEARRAVDEAYQTGISGLSESAGGSGAALRAGLTGLSRDYMSGVGKTMADIRKANIASKMGANQFNLQNQQQVAGQNAQMLNQADMYNTQLMNAKAASDFDNRMSYLAKGAEGLGDVGYESRISELMPKLYGYDQYGNYMVPLKKKCGGRLTLNKRK